MPSLASSMSEMNRSIFAPFYLVRYCAPSSAITPENPKLRSADRSIDAIPFYQTTRSQYSMCGILFSATFTEEPIAQNEALKPYIAARGPDSFDTHKIVVRSKTSRKAVELLFTSSVLHLRGHEVTRQPLVSEVDDVLCWNGEIWQGLEIADDQNDGVKLFEALTSGRPIWKVMEQVEGPW